MQNVHDFNHIKQTCHGMMKAEVYEKIYTTALEAPGNIFVELGSAHGASAVCLALALKDSGRSEAKVYTFDKFSSGGRKYYESEEGNINYLTENLKKFEVDEIVKTIKIDIDALTKEQVNSEIDGEIGLILLDTDGKIDRDFELFFDMLSDDASVIIDDMADRVRVSDKNTYFRVDQKHKITWLLTNSAISNGLLTFNEIVYQTWFGKKGSNPFSSWNQKEILENYRNLVFSNSERKK